MSAETAPQTPLPDQRIQDPGLAEVMAYAEKPHRDEIVERNTQKTLADATAEQAIEGWFNDPINDPNSMSTSEVIDIKKAANALKWNTLDANLDSEAKADKAAERARTEHQGGSITEYGPGGKVVYQTKR